MTGKTARRQRPRGRAMARRWLIAALLLLPAAASSQALSARFSTTAYVSEFFRGEDESARLFRAHELLQLTIGQLAGNRLSFHTYLQISDDLSESFKGDPRARFMHAYFNWQSASRRLQLRLGRQRVYGGVAYGSIDGITAEWRAWKSLSARIFAGSLAQVDGYLEFDKWADAHLWGGRLAVRKSSATKTGKRSFEIGASFMQRSRTPEDLPGAFRAEPARLTAEQQRLFGADARVTLGGYQVFARADYDVLRENIRRLSGEMQRDFAAATFGLGYLFRRPLVDNNSIFSAFAYEPMQEVFCHFVWRAAPRLQFDTRLATQIYDDESGLDLSVAGLWRGVNGRVQFANGYLGRQIGGGIFTSRVLSGHCRGFGGLHMTRYKLLSSGENRTSTVATLGSSLEISRDWQVVMEGQYLHNRFYDRDARVFLRMNYALLVR